MTSRFPNTVPPFPGWERRIYRLSRPVKDDDIKVFLGNEELYTRDIPSGQVKIIHKYGLIELHFIIDEPDVEVWFNPESGAYPSEYLDALLATRFN
jgi:hypothetical protein